VNRGRVVNVDVLRAVAALGVLAAHAYALGGRAVPIRAQHGYDVGLITLTTFVWLFFAISGYVIGRPFIDRLLSGAPLPPAGGYARRRALRILPLYWIALTAQIAIAGSQGTKAWEYPVHYLLLNNLVPGRQEALLSVAWTLTLEALFYILVPFMAVAVRRWRPAADAQWLARAVLVSWVLSIAFTVIADLQGDGEIGLWLRGSIAAMWQMFCPGLILAIAPHLPDGRLRRSLVAPAVGRPAWWAGVGAVIVVAALLGAAAPLRDGVVAYQLLVDASRPLFAIGYGLLLAAAIAAAPSRSRIALALGAASYGIYLLHAVIVSALEHLGWAPVPHDTLAGFLVNTAVLAALTIPLALASWRWLERPLMRMGSSRIGARAARGDAAVLE
jgi:peptidoglycan/LPS O-acetylase OafA/YrhL